MFATHKTSFLLAVVASLISCWSGHAQIVSSYGDTPATHTITRQPITSSYIGHSY